MRILTRPSFARSLNKYSDSEVAVINASIGKLPEAVGNPHAHSGLSIRKLRPAIFEIRVGLRIRILFARDGTDLVLIFAGNHDQLRAWLKSNV